MCLLVIVDGHVGSHTSKAAAEGSSAPVVLGKHGRQVLTKKCDISKQPVVYNGGGKNTNRSPTKSRYVLRTLVRSHKAYYKSTTDVCCY